MKEFADSDFKFDKNGRQFVKWVGNTVGRGEIAHFEQFFKKLKLQTDKNQGFSGKGLNQVSF